MHTLRTATRDHWIRVHHNGDWSGEVLLEWGPLYTPAKMETKTTADTIILGDLGDAFPGPAGVATAITALVLDALWRRRVRNLADDAGLHYEVVL